jgi:hypothetical protein
LLSKLKIVFADDVRAIDFGRVCVCPLYRCAGRGFLKRRIGERDFSEDLFETTTDAAGLKEASAFICRQAANAC